MPKTDLAFGVEGSGFRASPARMLLGHVAAFADREPDPPCQALEGADEGGLPLLDRAAPRVCAHLVYHSFSTLHQV